MKLNVVHITNRALSVSSQSPKAELAAIDRRHTELCTSCNPSNSRTNVSSRPHERMVEIPSKLAEMCEKTGLRAKINKKDIFF